MRKRRVRSVGSPPVFIKTFAKNTWVAIKKKCCHKIWRIIVYITIYNYVLYIDYLIFASDFIISPIGFHGLKGKRPTWDLNELRFFVSFFNLNWSYLWIWMIYISILAYISIRLQTWTCLFKKQTSFYGAALPNLELINHLVLTKTPPPLASLQNSPWKLLTRNPSVSEKKDMGRHLVIQGTKGTTRHDWKVCP